MKIKYQFSLFFLITTILLVSIASTIVYFQTKEMILNEKFAHLESVTETKEIRLKAILNKKYETVNVLSKIIQTNALIDSSNGIRIHPKEENYIAPIKKYRDALHSVKNVFLINEDGIILEALEDQFVGRLYIPKDTSHWHDDHWKGLPTNTSYIDGFFTTDKNKPIICICMPVYKKNIFIGTLIVDLIADDIISLTNDYTGLGHSGETVLY